MNSQDTPKRKPEWLRVRAFTGRSFEEVSTLLRQYGLNTVCQEANCPNRGECFNRGTATFLILGPLCTRNCRFCNIASGPPHAVDPTEPERIAEAARTLKLRHVVVTSVTRDDLPDGGAGQFVHVVDALRRTVPQATIELLTPDFGGSTDLIDQVLASRPTVFNHNIETVPSLYSEVRPGAVYQRSLDLLSQVADCTGVIAKSGLMVGLGEEPDELHAVFDDVAQAGVRILTIGQYLSPSPEHYPVKRYLPPTEFDELAEFARSCGIPTVVSGPLVRSSYLADQAF